MDWIQQWQSKLNKQNGVAPLVRTGGSRHTGLAAPPHRNIHYLSIIAFWCFTNAFYNVSQGLFQGCGHTLITMLVDASRIWIFRLLSLWICANVFHMGVASVWYSVVISNGTSAIILYLLYWTGIWKKGYADPL